ncbi:hypothetical protein [Aminipila terrae]|uniref:Uncharacterized protein n=1 Tax=Aminipila terrae TaxID=2697030 RepID=A0A6P1MD49_9FIRM|nr:hypothetical protein [Aminipila terrae]QHI71761.1 hypothetical protein Ami3637_04595 [Aminipila terrae]
MQHTKEFQNVCIPINQVNLIFDSRTIWRDLTIWLRSYINLKHGGLGDEEATKAKLEELLIKSINIFSIVFGEKYADEYVTISTPFINYLGMLIEAQISGETDTVDDYKNRLQILSAQAAAFLSHINPYWEENQWIELFSQYNQMSIDQSTALLNKDDKEDIYVFDKLLSLSSKIGDYYSQGILDYLMYAGRAMAWA